MTTYLKNGPCPACGARAGVTCRQIHCAALQPQAFTHVEPLAKGMSAAAADIPSAPGGAFVELPCIACHGRHAPGEGCGH